MVASTAGMQDSAQVSETGGARSFRDALGAFATGVTVVTARAPGGGDVGITANSFNSVSLDPPMVLWSLAKSSQNLSAFMEAGHFAVHVLASDQQALSDRFARRGEGKFRGIAVARGRSGAPLLEGCSVRFECRTVFRYEGGDHVILVGEVLAFDQLDKPPLVFHGGKYGLVVRRSAPGTAATQAADLAGSERSRLLTYLLAAVGEQIATGIRGEYVSQGLSDGEYFALMALEMEDRQPAADLLALAASTGRPASPALIEGLAAKGLVTRGDADRTALTEAGRALAVRFFAMTKAAEAEATQDLEEAERLVLQHLLRKVIRRSRQAAEVAPAQE